MIGMFSSSAASGRSSQGDFQSNRQMGPRPNELAHETQQSFHDIIRINVGGRVFETLERTLELYPETLLGDARKRKFYYNEDTGEYFFNRHRGAFECILYYYLSEGILLRPPDLPIHLFIQELKYFEMGKELISSMELEAGLREEEVETEMPTNPLFCKIWEFLEYPDSSIFAKMFAISSVVIISISLIMFVMETLPEFEPKEVQKINQTEVVMVPSRHYKWVHGINTAVIVWFTTEYLLRVITCPNKIKFFTGLLNVIDFLSILPYYLNLVIPKGDNSSLSILRVVRVIRVLRVFKLSRHSRGLQILGNTLKASFNELVMLGFFLFVIILIFGSCVYYAEQSVNDTKFTSIPASFWWAIVTMTTVGYGDMYPETVTGQIIGGAAVLCGVLTIALPVPVVVSNFELFYTKERNRKKLEEMNRRASSEDGSVAGKTCAAGAGSCWRRILTPFRYICNYKRRRKGNDIDLENCNGSSASVHIDDTTGHAPKANGEACHHLLVPDEIQYSSTV